MSTSRLTQQLIADRYATALFEATPEQEREQIAAVLDALGALPIQSGEFAALAESPLISTPDRIKGIMAVGEHLGLSSTLKAALQEMARQNRLSLLDLVSTSFQRLLRQSRGEVEATVISARPLETKERDALAKELGNTLGQSVVLQEELDASLIAGVKIRLGSVELDASAKGKLARMASRLYEGIEHAA